MSLKKESLTDVRLHRAAAGGDVQTVRCLLNSGKVHVDSRDKEGTTPLMLATAGGHFQCCRELLRNGANLRARRQSGATALFFAAQGGYTDIVQLLLSYSTDNSFLDAQCRDGATALIVAAQYGFSDVVQQLLDQGASPRFQMKDGASALFVAAQNGHSKVVSQLLEKTDHHKWDLVNQSRKDGATPLWITCQMGYDNIARLLLKAGASVNIPRMDGISPLLKACQKGHTDTVRELLRWSPYLGTEQNGESPLHVSVSNGYTSVVELLLRAGADPLLPNCSGITPYQMAVKTGQERILQLSRLFNQRNSAESSIMSSPSLSRPSDRQESMCIDTLTTTST